MNTVRCAIYTRKSSEEGLEQDFNSLDAQYEACFAYVLSQASEGWKLNKDRYDDGGLSGGTLERPGLQRLLADMEAGKINIVVVYKVDRLTRSLLDFAKLVETMDRSNVSFVSITQSFNTTTSMGRLTLNMLLSFAQFEREVTAERIRDKIAASKAKGMWMGGVPPLGYEPIGRSLKIVKDHAALIRSIYARYLELGNVRLLADELRQKGIKTPRRTTMKGKSYGGCFFSRGQLYKILSNSTYVGKIAHRCEVHEGKHDPIIEMGLWDAVQAKLADNCQGQGKARATRAALLKDLLFDERGRPLIPVHSSKQPKGEGGARTRYRYYVSKDVHHQTADEAGSKLRIPASEIERLVTTEIVEMLEDPIKLAGLTDIRVTPETLKAMKESCASFAKQFKPSRRSVVQALVSRVELHAHFVRLILRSSALLQSGDIAVSRDASIDIPVRIKRSGQVMRFVDRNGLAALEQPPDESLARLVAKAHDWWRRLQASGLDVTTFAAREGVTRSYLTRVVRLAFLSPEIVEAILEGNQGEKATIKRLLGSDTIVPSWQLQRKILLGSPSTPNFGSHY